MTPKDLAKRTPQEVFTHHAQALGAEDLDATFIARREIEQATDERRLAGAVRTDEAERFAWRDVQIHFVERDERAVAFDERCDAHRGRLVRGSLHHAR